ncbi:hypothetical protein D9V37_02965 [Nocardioides mangrovicus]|uniref:DUF1440 domain-containing protein n=2 Tax=Nocardioides mangrovicus TaxID=2478913 RepID=A0A3L8P7Z8_9ACTN|nr:hypothetical protein D9V37_02965 [Nocardioides mangrovicus]
MAMSGARGLTSNLDLMEETPPETVVKQTVPGLLSQMSPGQRAAFAEAVHWAYGGTGAAVCGLLPTPIRSSRVAGVAYGIGIWLGFEAVVAPALGVRNPQEKIVGRAMLALDHALYGIIIAGR